MSGGFRKVKHFFFAAERLFTFWRPVEVKSKQHTRFGLQKNSLAPAGKAINAYGQNLSLLSSSYQLQCRYASRMCLVENAQHERIFAYIQSGFARTKAARQLFCSSLLFCSREFNRFLEISVRDPRKILRVSRNSKLDPRNSILDPRNSILETRASKLDSRFSKTSRIENRVSSRDCQLTFERYCTCNLP